MMRAKCLLLGFVLTGALCSLGLQAAPVSADRAVDLARKVLDGVSTRSGSGQLRVVWDGQTAADTQAPAFYVVGRDGGGFVIIAGDDRVSPVLALSDKGSFRVEGMPENVRWWMERMKAWVRCAPDTGTSAQWGASTRASTLPDDGVTVSVSHPTPEWDQGNNDKRYFSQNVFNAKCPMVGSDYTIAGCVPVALAELLVYESGLPGVTMPAAAHGTVESYQVGSDYVTPQTPYVLGTPYDWEGLRTLTDISAVRTALNQGQTALLENLAQLIADLGAVIHAAYSTRSTSSSVSMSRLIEHFDINKRARREVESDYTARKWVAMLKAELNARPLLYSGRNPRGGGHQFLFDGYGKYGDEDVFHVNFGWGGSCNGYYRHFDLDAGDGHDYSYDGDAIFGFYPDAASTYEAILSYRKVSFTDGTFGYGLSVDSPLQAGRSAVLKVEALKNAGSGPYSGSFKVVQEDKDGNVVRDNVLTTSISLDPGYYTWFSRSIQVRDLSFGDKLVGYYSVDADNAVWEKVRYPENGTMVGEVPVMPAAFIRTEASYSVGDWFEFRLRNYDALYAGTVWTLTAPDGTRRTYGQSEVECQLVQAGKYRVEAAIAPEEGADIVERLVAFITVR